MQLNYASRLALCSLAFLLLNACAGLGPLTKRPELSLVNIERLQAGNLEQRFALTFRIINPNSLALPIRGMSFDIDLQGTNFARGATPQQFDVPAFGEETFTVEVSTNLIKTASVLYRLFDDQSRQIDYQVDADIETELLGRRTLKIRTSDSLSLR